MSSEAALHQLKTATPRSAEFSQPRFSEPIKFLPVAFVCAIIAGIWFIYMFCHCLPMLAVEATIEDGRSHLAVFNLFTVLLLTCYFRCVVTHPGTIPDVSVLGDGQVNWEYTPQDGRAPRQSNAAVDVPQSEKKRLGDRRHCKWCNKYKPDRCHHCRVCRMCVLKMDHHCPWIYNCVGFGNFKYFFLLVLYVTLVTQFVFWTMLQTSRNAVNDPTTPFMRMFVILFGQTLAGVTALLLTTFLCFHIYLMFKAMTTIEFCEKSRRPHYDDESYSRGALGNVKAVLGDNVLLWPFPVCPPTGNGVTFGKDSEKDSILQSKDMDAQRNMRRKAHERATYNTMTPALPAGTGEAPTCVADVETSYAAATLEAGQGIGG